MSGTQTQYTLAESNVGIADRPAGIGAALFQDQILAIGGDSGGHLWLTTYPQQSMANWLTYESLGVSQNWSSVKAMLPSASGSWQPVALGRCGAGTTGSGDQQVLYFAWAQSGGAVMASAYLGQDSKGDPQWQAGLVLLDSAGNPLVSAGRTKPENSSQNSADIELRVWDGSTLLIALVADQAGTPALYLGAFNTANQWPGTTQKTGAGTFGTWQAAADGYYPASLILAALPLYAMKNLAPQVGFEWFLSSFSGQAGPFALFSVLADVSSDGGTTYTSQNANLLIALDPTSGGPATDDHPINPQFFAYSSNATVGVPELRRDPFGRLYGIAANQSWPGGTTHDQLMWNVYPLLTIPGYPESGAGYVNVLSAKSAWGPRPSVLFAVDSNNATTTQGPNATGQQQTSVTFPVCQILFYGGSSCVLQQQFYGTAVSIQNYAQASPVTRDGNYLYAVVGIMEGAIPIPLQNVVGYPYESNPAGMGSLVYGNSSETETTATTSWSWNAGFQFSWKYLVSGVGFSIQASFAGGAQGETGATHATTAAQTLSMSAQMTAGQGSSTASGIYTTGAFWSGQTGITVTACQFYDADGNLIADGTVAARTDPNGTPGVPSAIVMPAFGTPSSHDYVPFLVSPGDISSYTPESINATMQKLNPGIPNYYGDVILANALPFGEESYLTYSWTESGGENTASDTMLTGTINQSGWQLSASLYAGVAWQFGANIPETNTPLYQNEGSFLIGDAASFSWITTATTTDQWSLSISPTELWGPPTSGGPTSGSTVTQYTFRVFFLPDPTPGGTVIPGDPVSSGSALAPGYWVDEMLKYAPRTLIPDDLASVDSTSGCWKIVFVVTAYELQDGTSYTYDGTLDSAQAPRPGRSPRYVNEKHRSAEAVAVAGR